MITQEHMITRNLGLASMFLPTHLPKVGISKRPSGLRVHDDHPDPW